MLATHNQHSIELAAARLLADGSAVPRERIYFAQLLGMADHLTFTLAANGFKSYKYVPYGPVEEVLPYLIRRAQENSDALSGGARARGRPSDPRCSRASQPLRRIRPAPKLRSDVYTPWRPACLRPGPWQRSPPARMPQSPRPRPG